jgi:hypothetical protein
MVHVLVTGGVGERGAPSRRPAGAGAAPRQGGNARSRTRHARVPGRRRRRARLSHAARAAADLPPPTRRRRPTAADPPSRPTGFIGSHTVLALLEQGHSVVIVDDLSNSFPRVFSHMQKLAGPRASKMKFVEVRGPGGGGAGARGAGMGSCGARRGAASGPEAGAGARAALRRAVSTRPAVSDAPSLTPRRPPRLPARPRATWATRRSSTACLPARSEGAWGVDLSWGRRGPRGEGDGAATGASLPRPLNPGAFSRRPASRPRPPLTPPPAPHPAPLKRPDAVIHFAGSKAVAESIEQPLHYYR